MPLKASLSCLTQVYVMCSDTALLLNPAELVRLCAERLR